MGFAVRRLRVLLIASATIIFGLYYLRKSPDDWGSSSPFPALNLPKPDGRPHFVPRSEDFPVTSFIPLPTNNPISMPMIQTRAKPEIPATKAERLKRQAAVKASFVHSWEGYKQHAWLRDEVVPVSGGFRDPFGGWAATLVDALDTLWIMGLKGDFEMAVNALKEIDFTTTESDKINVFETTIRYLGGFLGAYDISGAKYPLLLMKAIEVGDLLMGCFDTPNRLPTTRWDWKSYLAHAEQEAPSQVIVSELGSLTIEFTRLSQITGNDKYYDAVQRISNVFEQHQNRTKLPGMWPVVVDASTPAFHANSDFHIGGMIDSLYEYLPKQYMMLGGVLKQPRKMYESFIEVAKSHLFYRPLNLRNLDLLIPGEMRVAPDGNINLQTRGQHLGCFAGGMIAIGSRIFNRPNDLEIGKRITDGCVWAYDSQVTGIAPEIFSVIGCKPGDCEWSEERWHKGIAASINFSDGNSEALTEKALQKIKSKRLAPGYTEIDDPRYILRPEAIESVFIMYRITGDVEWQNKAWRMFGRIKQATHTPIAYSAIDDVTKDVPTQTDSMESFWLAETLKYFYLIFSEMELVDLDKYILNTEAHPLKRPGT